jgi:hypothetical protein
MMDTLLTTDIKTHDETRQGEAFAPFKVDDNSIKNDFILKVMVVPMNLLIAK